MEQEVITSGSIILGALAIVSLVIRELFTYLKSRKDGSSAGHDAAILQELQRMNNNHLHSVEDAINKGNERLVDAIHSSSSKQIEILGRIEGNLRK